jgi:hypothetical protein
MKIFLAVLTMLLPFMAQGEQNSPKQYRVTLVLIELGHADLTTLLATSGQSGQDLFGRCMAWQKEGKADIVASSILALREMQKSTEGSFHEVCLPEYQKPMPPKMRGPVPDYYMNYCMHPAVRPYTCFYSDEIGMKLEVSTGKMIDGEVELKIYTHYNEWLRTDKLSHYVDQWGDASKYMPVIERRFVSTSLAVKPGEYSLISLMTPQVRQQDARIDRKILAFAKLDLLSRP